MPIVESQRTKLARRWGMTLEQVDAWLAVEPRSWAVDNAKVLHAAGLSPADAKELHDRLDKDVRADIGRLVDAGRMASLDTAFLHHWAASGLLRSDVAVDPRGRRRGKTYTGWVTAARRFITATGGDQRLAALAAAAGLGGEETAERYAAGDLTVDTLLMLAGLRGFGSPTLPSGGLFGHP